MAALRDLEDSVEFEMYHSNGNEPLKDNYIDSIKPDDISKPKLRKLVNRLENNKDITVFINEDKLVKTRTRFENEKDEVIIWDYSIPVEVYDELFKGTDRLSFPENNFYLKDYYTNKYGHLYFVFEHDNENVYINSYYFEFLEKKKDQTPEGKNKGREKEMSKFEQTVSQTVGANKKAAKTAAMIKVGGTANKTVSDIIRKNLPKKYQKISTNPFFELAVANAFAIGMKQFSSDRRVDNLSDAMLTASMVEITNMINFQDILSQVMEKVDTSILNEE